jgi:hypothetical protein
MAITTEQIYLLNKMNSIANKVQLGTLIYNAENVTASEIGLTDTYILVGNGSNVGAAVAMSGDATIANTGAVTIADDAVSLAKMANITQGSIIVGGASDAPTYLDAKTDTQILVGDGTDLNSVAVSGDATLANDGALTIADDAVSLAKMANITQGSIIVGGGSDAPTYLDAKTDAQILIGDGTDLNSVAVTGDVTISNAGVTAIESDVIVDADVKTDAAISTSKLALATAGIVFGAGTPTSIFDASGLTSATNTFKFADGIGATVGAMTAKSPETDAEAGYLTIDVGGTTYEIPFYAIA